MTQKHDNSDIQIMKKKSTQVYNPNCSTAQIMLYTRYISWKLLKWDGVHCPLHTATSRRWHALGTTLRISNEFNTVWAIAPSCTNHRCSVWWCWNSGAIWFQNTSVQYSSLTLLLLSYIFISEERGVHHPKRCYSTPNSDLTTANSKYVHNRFP